jgi:ATP diphosphatase
MSDINKLLQVMRDLRDPETGCPWDVEQDFSTIAPYTIEEAYEVADAIERNNMDDLRDELGDLLLQVVFHARMAEEAGLFDFEDVADGISEKMLRRHPHVFGTDEERADGKKDGSWEQIKEGERSESSDDSALAGVAKSQPALKRAEKLGKRAASTGFDWPDAEGPRQKIDEELAELDLAGQQQDGDALADELGDLLFSAVNLARHLKIDPEQALVAASGKFERRFRDMESRVRRSGRDLAELDLETLEAEWQRSKETLSQPPDPGN